MLSMQHHYIPPSPLLPSIKHCGKFTLLYTVIAEWATLWSFWAHRILDLKGPWVVQFCVAASMKSYAAEIHFTFQVFVLTAEVDFTLTTIVYHEKQGSSRLATLIFFCHFVILAVIRGALTLVASIPAQITNYLTMFCWLMSIQHSGAIFSVI